jgi:minor curlin subunit
MTSTVRQSMPQPSSAEAYCRMQQVCPSRRTVMNRSPGHRLSTEINVFSQTRVTSMKTATSKLFPFAVATMLAVLCGPVSAGSNINTTIQEGRINTNDTLQRGDLNDNATYQEGRDNANRTRQWGADNRNQTGQFGRINYNETHQRGRFNHSSLRRGQARR